MVAKKKSNKKTKKKTKKNVAQKKTKKNAKKKVVKMAMKKKLDDENKIIQDNKMNNKDEVISLYNSTCAEITRYRDIEWRNQGIFTASMIAIIGFIISHPTEASKSYFLFDVILVVLAVGNVLYTGIAHKNLTVQRNVLSRLRKYLGLDKLQVEGLSILPDKWFEKGRNHKRFYDGLLRGFWSHLLLFWVFDFFLVIFGIYLIHSNSG